MPTRSLTIALAVLLFAASGAAQAGIEGTKAAGIEGQEICILDNGYTGVDFRDAYERRINAKGYKTRIVHDKTECPIVTTFVASYVSNHGWGRVIRVAMFTILRDGEEIAAVRYNAKRGERFKGRAEDLIGEMVDALYP